MNAALYSQFKYSRMQGMPTTYLTFQNMYILAKMY